MFPHLFVMKWWDWIPWSSLFECWVFKPAFSLSSSTFIKRLFSSSLSAIRVVLSTYLRSLIFLLGILIPVCASSSPAFLVMYSAYKLNKQGDNIQPWCTPFPIWNQSVVPCPVLMVASWPAPFSGWASSPLLGGHHTTTNLVRHPVSLVQLQSELLGWNHPAQPLA